MTPTHNGRSLSLVRCAAALPALVLVALLAGCPPPPGEQQATGPTPTGAPKGAAPAEGGGKLTFLAMEYDTNTKPYMERIEKAFKEANPDIDLSIETIDWNAGKDKLSTLISAGNAPDLANIATLWLPEMVSLDVVEALDSYVKPEFREKFIPISLRGAEYQGKLYGLPIAVSARALYCNAGLLDAAGQKPPATWDELVKVAGKVQNPSKGIAGIGVQGSKVETDVYFYYFLWANGGEILSEDGSKSVFNSPEGVEALQFMCDLVSKDKVAEPNPTAYDREGLQEMFKAGKLAMTITGPWFWKMLKEKTPDLKYSIAPIPAKKKQVTMAVTDNIVMMKSCQNKEAAWKFIEFLYQPELRQEWAETFGMLPELKSVGESDFITKSEEWSSFMELLSTGKFVPLHPRWTAIAEQIVTGVQQALMGKQTPAEALNAAAERVDKLLVEDAGSAGAAGTEPAGA